MPAFLLILSGPAIRASVVEPTAGLPPSQGFYAAAGPVNYPGVSLSQVTLGEFSDIVPTFSAGNESVSFDSVLAGLVSLGGGTPAAFTLTGPVDSEVFGRTSDSELGTFNVRMTSMDVTGSVGGHSVEVVEVMLDPSDTTTGQTTIAATAGGFLVSSFFDVFTEISLDGGPFTAQTNGPTSC